MSTFWARRIRWAILAARDSSRWPVYIFLNPTRRAFDREFGRSIRPVWPVFYSARKWDRLYEQNWKRSDGYMVDRVGAAVAVFLAFAVIALSTELVLDAVFSTR